MPILWLIALGAAGWGLWRYQETMGRKTRSIKGLVGNPEPEPDDDRGCNGHPCLRSTRGRR